MWHGRSAVPPNRSPWRAQPDAREGPTHASPPLRRQHAGIVRVARVSRQGSGEDGAWGFLHETMVRRERAALYLRAQIPTAEVQIVAGATRRAGGARRARGRVRA